MLDPGATFTSVNKTAIAAFTTIGQARPGLPVIIGQCGECYNSDCAYTYKLVFGGAATSTDTAAWLRVGDGGADATIALVPAGCGGGGQTSSQYFAGTTVTTNNGAQVPICRTFECLVGKEYLVPVMQQCGGPYPNLTRQIVGFATIKILKVHCNPTPEDNGGCPARC